MVKDLQFLLEGTDKAAFLENACFPRLNLQAILLLSSDANVEVDFQKDFGRNSDK